MRKTETEVENEGLEEENGIKGNGTQEKFASRYMQRPHICIHNNPTQPNPAQPGVPALAIENAPISSRL
jgi:hypothetical protein